MQLKNSPRFMASLLMLLLVAGCSPAPMTDAQVKIIADSCAKQGKATRIFNSGMVSSAECIDTAETSN